MKRLFTILVFLSATTAVAAQQKLRSVKIEEVEQLISNSKGPLIINFWATFCGPCIKEMPYISSITDSVNKTTPVQLIYVSLDLKEAYPKRVEDFLQKRNITDSCLWLNETNADHFCPKVDEKWSGSIPATLFVNNKTGYRKFMEEELSPAKFRQQIALLVK